MLCVTLALVCLERPDGSVCRTYEDDESVYVGSSVFTELLFRCQPLKVSEGLWLYTQPTFCDPLSSGTVVGKWGCNCTFKVQHSSALLCCSWNKTALLPQFKPSQDHRRHFCFAIVGSSKFFHILTVWHGLIRFCPYCYHHQCFRVSVSLSTVQTQHRDWFGFVVISPSLHKIAALKHYGEISLWRADIVSFT